MGRSVIGLNVSSMFGFRLDKFCWAPEPGGQTRENTSLLERLFDDTDVKFVCFLIVAFRNRRTSHFIDCSRFQSWGPKAFMRDLKLSCDSSVSGTRLHEGKKRNRN